MWSQILTIVWAQLRTTRNHLPRSGFGSVLIATLSLIWYGVFVALAVLLAIALPVTPMPLIREWLGAGLLVLLVCWQAIPFVTFSGGWSLHLKKLQPYPIPTSTLFSIETLLRITTALEMFPILIGGCVGLIRRTDIPAGAPLCLLLFIPLNLLLSVFLREFVLHSFGQNRLREVMAILVVSLSVLPQVILRTGAGHTVQPYLLWVSTVPASPWFAVGRLSLGEVSPLPLVAFGCWLVGLYFAASQQFKKAIAEEELPRSQDALGAARRSYLLPLVFRLCGRLFGEPVGTMMEKETRSLLRMPRFRVIFGMACFFSVIVFIPFAVGRSGTPFMHDNFLPVVNLYGLLLLGDALIWNIFGFDGRAAATYFVTPVAMKDVFLAKNLTAAMFMLWQSLIVLAVATLLRFPVTMTNLAAALLASTTVGLFFIAVGNLSSVAIPRPVNPNQTLKKQAGAQVQVWLFGCAVGMFLLVGLAFLARWAVQSDWAMLAVFAVECGIGIIVFQVTTSSALLRAERDRERIVDALSKAGSQLAL